MNPLTITGASGFVGTRLTQVLDERKRTYITLSHRLGASVRPPIQPGSAVIHLAGLAHRMNKHSEGDLEAYRDANVRWSLQVAKLAVECGASRFIYVSTIKVNGERTDKTPFTAQDSPNPRGPYALSKWEAEQGLSEICAAANLEFMVVRPPLIYGPGVKGNLNRLMRLIASGLPLPFGSAFGVRSMISATNLSDFLLYLTDLEEGAVVPSKQSSIREKLEPWGYPIFLPSDIHLSTVNLIRALAEKMGKPAKLIPIPSFFFRPTRLYNRLFSSLSVDPRECMEIGWKNRVTADEALGEMVQSFRFSHAHA